jgi:hypothetical protein
MNEQFDRILDECLDRLNSTEALGKCLSNYPEVASELEPLLQTVEDVRFQSAFIPSKSARAKGMARLKQAIDELERWYCAAFPPTAGIAASLELVYRHKRL